VSSQSLRTFGDPGDISSQGAIEHFFVVPAPDFPFDLQSLKLFLETAFAKTETCPAPLSQTQE